MSKASVKSEVNFKPKSDGFLVAELKEITDALVGKINELRERGMIATINLSNGEGDKDNKASMTNFMVVKKIMPEVGQDN